MFETGKYYREAISGEVYECVKHDTTDATLILGDYRKRYRNFVVSQETFVYYNEVEFKKGFGWTEYVGESSIS